MTHPPGPQSPTERVRPALLLTPRAKRRAALTLGPMFGVLAALASGCLPDAATTGPEPSGLAGGGGSAGSGGSGTGGAGSSGSGGRPPTGAVLHGDFVPGAVLAERNGVRLKGHFGWATAANGSANGKVLSGTLFPPSKGH